MTKRKCSIKGCPTEARERGWCVKHLRRWQAHGDPNYVRPPRIPQSCAVEDCPRESSSRGYCNRHYENLRKYGDPVPRRDRALEARLREVGWTVTASGCWEWNGKRNDNGYGLFTARRLGYENARAHRAMYECYTARIPDELLLRHKCDNPPCVNPEHLIPGTPLDNSRDMVERRRHSQHGRTSCDNGHDLTIPGALRRASKAGTEYWMCVECDRARKRRWDAKQPKTWAALVAGQRG